MILNIFLLICIIPLIQTCENTFIIESNKKITNGKVILEKHVDSLTQCSRFCISIKSCTHFNFIISSNSSQFSCTLFNEINPKISTFGSSSLGTKQCLERKCLKRSFAFEKYGGRSLLNSTYIIRTFSIGVDQCLNKCQEDPSCRASLFNRDTSLCQLSKISLNSVYNPRLYFKQNPSIDLYDNNCIEYTMTQSGCTFMRVNTGGIKELSDQIIQNIQSVDECEQMCLVRTRIADPCRSYTYDKKTKECYLMWSSARMSGRSPLENMDDNLSHGDLDDCVNFSLKCRKSNLEVKASSMRMFIGKMMTKKSKSIMCEEVYDGEYDFSTKFDFETCGLEPNTKQDKTYKGVVHVKEGSTSLVTIRDKILQVNCRMHQNVLSDEQSLSVRMNVRENNKTNHIMSDDTPLSSTTSPLRKTKFSLKILTMNSTEANSVHIGDYGWIVMNIINGADDFTVTSLIARDTKSGNVLQIIDEDGCVVRRDIVKEIHKSNDSLKLKVSFSGFKRQTEVVYHAMVETCTVGCMPKCNQDLMEILNDFKTIPLSLDIPKHRMMRRAINGEPRQLQLTNDVYQVQGHRLTLLNPDKNVTNKMKKNSYEFDEKGEYHDGEVMVIKNSATIYSSFQHCFVEDITCLFTLVLATIQIFLLISCILIMYCYCQQWRQIRNAHSPHNHNIEYYRTDRPKTPERPLTN